MKNNLVKKAYDDGLYLIFGLQTCVFGIYLLFNPDTFSAKGAYTIVAEMLNEGIVSFILIGVGLFNILIILLDKKNMKAVGLISMQFIWSLFFFAFLLKQISGQPTTGWILILGLVLTMAYEAWRGVAK